MGRGGVGWCLRVCVCVERHPMHRRVCPKYIRQIVQKQDRVRQLTSRTNWLLMVAREAMTKTHHTVPCGIVAASFSALSHTQTFHTCLFCNVRFRVSWIPPFHGKRFFFFPPPRVKEMHLFNIRSRGLQNADVLWSAPTLKVTF